MDYTYCQLKTLIVFIIFMWICWFSCMCDFMKLYLECYYFLISFNWFNFFVICSNFCNFKIQKNQTRSRSYLGDPIWFSTRSKITWVHRDARKVNLGLEFIQIKKTSAFQTGELKFQTQLAQLFLLLQGLQIRWLTPHPT